MTKDEALKLALKAMLNFPKDISDEMFEAITAIKEALAQPKERNFCPRCGKRLGKNDWDIHTCTPPQTDEFKCPLCYDDIANIKNPSQPEQEPVAWGVDWGKAGDIPCVSIIKRLPDGGIQVLAVEYAPYSYTTPPQRTWVGLTRDEVLDIEETTKHPLEFYRAIEAKLKQKNGHAEENT